MQEGDATVMEARGRGRLFTLCHRLIRHGFAATPSHQGKGLHPTPDFERKKGKPPDRDLSGGLPLLEGCFEEDALRVDGRSGAAPSRPPEYKFIITHKFEHSVTKK